MNDTIKSMKLDFLLLKPYLKSLFLVLLVPILFPLFPGTLFEGLSFSATVLAMTTGYTFSIVEKNSMERLYGFLPAKKKAMVQGRYLFVFLTGFTSLAVTMLAQILILNAIHSAPGLRETGSAFLVCATLFCIYACVQIPGYYRYGAIKGRIFMFIPTVGYLIFYFVVRKLSAGAGIRIFSYPFFPYFIVLGILVLAVVSLNASGRIVEKSSL